MKNLHHPKMFFSRYQIQFPSCRSETNIDQTSQVQNNAHFFPNKTPQILSAIFRNQGLQVTFAWCRDDNLLGASLDVSSSLADPSPMHSRIVCIAKHQAYKCNIMFIFRKTWSFLILFLQKKSGFSVAEICFSFHYRIKWNLYSHCSGSRRKHMAISYIMASQMYVFPFPFPSKKKWIIWR